MSGAAQLLRQRHQANARPVQHRTKVSQAAALRACAVSLLTFQPPMPDDVVKQANEMLDMVGEMLQTPRSGWYPRRPRGWRS